MKKAYVLLFNRCNYRCPYCCLRPHRNSAELGRLGTLEGIGRLVDHFAQFGAWELNLRGGEVSLHPEFYAACKLITARHHLGMTTNLSFDVNRLLNEVPAASINHIGASLQPQADLDEFMAKVMFLKRHRVPVVVTMVCNPERFALINMLRARFKAENIPFCLQALLGAYQGKTYPQAYTREQYAIIRDHTIMPSALLGLDYRQIAYPKGEKCSAGFNRVFVDGYSGDIRPCEKRAVIGNIYHGTMTLDHEPATCSADTCSCLYFDRLAECQQRILHKTWPGQSRISDEDWAEYADLATRNSGRLAAEINRWMTGLFSPATGSIALYCAGSHTVKLLALLKRMALGGKITALIDQDERKWGGTIGSIRIYPPGAMAALNPDKIVISSRTYEEQLRDELSGQASGRPVEIATLYQGNPLAAVVAHLIMNEMTIEEYIGASSRRGRPAGAPLSRGGPRRTSRPIPERI